MCVSIIWCWKFLVFAGVALSWQVDDSDPVEEMTEAANKRKEVVGKFNRHAR